MEKLDQLQARVAALADVFEVRKLKTELDDLDRQTADPGFWNDTNKAAEVQRKRSRSLAMVELFERLAIELVDLQAFADLLEIEPDDSIKQELRDKYAELEKQLEELEFKRMLSGEFDFSNAIVSINSGAGGTEAQDWVQMLLRMYLRWAENHGYETQMIDVLPGEEAGLKNVTLTVTGEYAYGYLRAEQGIHRLVRISPFDANSRRHTSFASVSVLPEIEDDIEVEILDEDLRVDTYRSSGAGGQHVNKTDSAVRLTHMPSGIVVACQSERSQHKNRAQAMKVLKARLYEKQRAEQIAKKEQIAGEKKDIGFGSQIRSYTLQPYQLIKDHRTGEETGKVQAVLDGEIESFIRSYLLKVSGVAVQN